MPSFLVSSETRKARLRLILSLLLRYGRSDTSMSRMMSVLMIFCMRKQQLKPLPRGRPRNVEDGSAG